jgi:hypothetical protein
MAAYNLDEKTGLLGKLGIKLSAKVLKENDFVDFKHFNMFGVSKASVIGISDPYVKLEINDLPQIEIFPEDHVVLNYINVSEFYVISAKIVEIESFSPAVVVVMVDKVEKMKDLRKYERFYVSLPAYLKVPGVMEPVFGVVTNVSVRGIKLNCNMNLMMEDIIEMVITLDKVEKLNFRGKIVRKIKINQFYEYGFEIHDITEGNRRNLFHFVNQYRFEIK